MMADSSVKPAGQDGTIRQMPSPARPQAVLHRRLLAIPRIVGPHIDRHLLHHQSITDGHPLTVVHAPFGSGKTTLGVTLASSSRVPVAWLTMSTTIDEPIAFLHHLWTAIGGALSTANPAFPLAPTSIGAEVAGGSLSDALIETGAEVRLLIDDAHRITDSGCLRIVTDLVLHAPPGLQLILLGRSAPAIPMSTLRLKGLLGELGPSDLALDSAEAFALSRTLAPTLDEQQVEAIRERTAGWIGGMRMALSIASASGSDQTIDLPGMDTIAEDVLAEFDPDVRRFVAAISILDELEISAVQAIASTELDAEKVKSTMETLALLGYVQDLSGAGQHRPTLHPAVRQALRQRLANGPRSDRQVVHQRAAHWFERSGRTREAVRHALAGDLPGEACDIIERALPELLNREEWRVVDDLLQLVPVDKRAQRPRLQLASAWVSHLSGRFEPILEMEQQALKHLALGALQPGDQQEIPAQFTLLKFANSLLVESSPEGALCDIRNARKLIPQEQRLARGLGSLLEGWALACCGRFDESTQVMGNEIARQSETIDACSIRLMIGLMFTYRVGGNIGACERSAEDVVALAGANDLPVSRGWGLWLAGLMAYEQDDLPLAEARLSGMEAIGDIAHLLALREAMFCLAMTRLALGRPDDAMATVRRLRDFVLDRHSAGILPGIRSFEARLSLQLGDLPAARAWLASSQSTPANTNLLAFEHEALTRAKALIATEGMAGVAEARRLIDVVRARAHHAHSRSVTIEVLALSAVTNQTAGNQVAAQADLAASLDLAGGDRYIRTYLEHGQAILPILARLDSARHPHAADLMRRIAKEPSTESAPAPPLRQAHDRESILSVLTIREAEVLERLTRRLTNAEIAEELSISLQTVKSHAANIYGKLGVNSRREAIIAAESYDMGAFDSSSPKSLNVRRLQPSPGDY